MPHSHIRHEKTCLNCGAIVEKRYCPECGQENIAPKQTLWHLITHFFNDITHFDGKLFHTLKYLLLRPGFLSGEYIRGRRMKYLDPIRMYLFISAIFAIVFVSTQEKDEYISLAQHPHYVQLVDSMRQVAINNYDGGIYLNIDSIDGYEINVFVPPVSWRETQAHYDSVQWSLPKSQRASWLQRIVEKKEITVYSAYMSDPYNFIPKFEENLYHSFSKIFFISLPLFAFYLYLLYIRRRQQQYFVAHAIFAIHYYCVALIVFMLINIITMWSNAVIDTINEILCAAIFIYLYIAMLKFYNQGWFKTFIKFFMLSFITSISLIIIIVGILFNSLLAIAH